MQIAAISIFRVCRFIMFVHFSGHTFCFTIIIISTIIIIVIIFI